MGPIPMNLLWSPPMESTSTLAQTISSPDHPTDPHPTYQQYIQMAREYDPRFVELTRLLRQHGPVPEKTQIMVAGSNGTKILLKNWPLGVPFSLQGEQDYSTRIIIIRHPAEPKLIDGTKFAAVAEELKIDVMWMWRHIFKSKTAPICPVPEQPPGYTTSGWIVELDYLNSKASMLVHPDPRKPNRKTIVILTSDHDGIFPDPHIERFRFSYDFDYVMANPSVIDPQLADLIASHLFNMDPVAVASAERHPVEYLILCAKYIIFQICCVLQYCEAQISMNNCVDNLDIIDVEQVVVTVHRIIAIIGRHARLFPGPTIIGFPNVQISLQTATLLDDWHHLENYARMLDNNISSILTRKVSLTALEESRKTIEHANNMKKITQMAFLFIPLTFAATLFSMEGSLKNLSWMYSIAAVGSITITLMLWRLMDTWAMWMHWFFPRWERFELAAEEQHRRQKAKAGGQKAKSDDQKEFPFKYLRSGTMRLEMLEQAEKSQPESRMKGFSKGQEWSVNV